MPVCPTTHTVLDLASQEPRRTGNRILCDARPSPAGTNNPFGLWNLGGPEVTKERRQIAGSINLFYPCGCVVELWTCATYINAKKTPKHGGKRHQGGGEPERSSWRGRGQPAPRPSRPTTARHATAQKGMWAHRPKAKEKYKFKSLAPNNHNKRIPNGTEQREGHRLIFLRKYHGCTVT